MLELRAHKVYLVKYMKDIGERLAEIRMEVPAKLAKSPPPIPHIDEELEFPERHLEVNTVPIIKFKTKHTNVLIKFIGCNIF